MNFANPTALLWLGLAVPIVIFYILKIRLRRVPVSTTLFWRQIFEEKQPRSIWQHLRHLLSLMLQLAFLCLLAFALAEPLFNWEKLEARRIVLVVDNSASMNATDISPTRLAKAKEEGRRFIDGLRFNDEVAVVAAGTQPQVLCGLTGHQRTLQNVLDAVTGTDGPTRVPEAVALARRLLADKENSQVVVLTDGCFEGADALAEAGDVRWVVVGRKTGNVGITQFQVRRSLLDPIGYEILAEVQNYSDEPVECHLGVDLNEQHVEVQTLKLEPGAKWTRVFEKTSAEGGRLVARLDRADALPADNEAQALLPHREFQPVVLVTEGNLFLAKVFEASPLVRLMVVREVPKAVPAGALVVYHRKVPARLPAGNVLVIDPETGCDLWDVGDKLQNPIVTKLDKDSPLMAHVRLDNVLMPEARKLTFKGQPHVLAQALTGEPLYAALERPEGKVLVLTVNLDQGDLPLRTAFPILTTNALGWFAGSKGELREAVAAGAVTDVELTARPAGAELLLRAPDGTNRKLPAGGNKFTVGPLDQVGVWQVVTPPAEGQEPGPPLYEIACNLASRGESDIRTPDALREKSAEQPLTAGFAGRPVWFYLIALAWLLTAVEWCLYQRRTIS